MHGDLILVVIVLVVGFGAFLFAVLYVTFTALASIGRVVTGLFRGAPVARARSVKRPALQCPQAKCRHIEYRAARFCCRCGAKLVPGDLR